MTMTETYESARSVEKAVGEMSVGHFYRRKLILISV